MLEDKRTALAVFLIFIVVMVYSELVISPYTRPRPVPVAQPTVPQVSQPAGSTSTAPAAAASPQQIVPAQGAAPAAPQDQKPPNPAELEASPKIVVENDTIITSISLLGGRPASIKLKDYKARLGSDDLLDLVQIAENQPLPLGIYSGGRNDAHVNYALEGVSAGFDPAQQSFRVGSEDLQIKLSGHFSDGTAVSKSFRFSPGSYLFDVEARLSQASSDGSALWLEWTNYLSEAGANDGLDIHQFSYLTPAGKIQHLLVDRVEPNLSEPLSSIWLAFNGKYFTSTLIPTATDLNARYGRQERLFISRVRGTSDSGSFKVYAGPKDYRVLKGLAFQLERSIDLGFFSFLAYPLLLGIRFFNDLFGNYGLAIIGLTLLIKCLFFPLTKASLRSAKAMQELQPEIKALRERIKDQNQLNQEMMGLFKKRGVNPLGGCLPILVQIPVFFGLYSALLNSIELRHAPFALWVQDLSGKESIPIMTVLMGVVMFVQQYTTPMPQVDPAQRRMMLIMTIIFPVSFLIFPFPAGLVLYTLVNATISLIQQAYLRSDTKANPFRAMLLASLGIFLLGFILTRL
ncbi:MAG: hypothetical protein DCC75_03090 [Proteobacteria bacterium]|nr:MAG: hypothetical protein DCC75_03090 [Pseudomonadota bacterium]